MSTEHDHFAESTASNRQRLTALCGCLAALVGCQQIETRFDILSFREPTAPELFTERFGAGACAQDARKNWDIVFEIPPTDVELIRPNAAQQTASQPAQAEKRMRAERVRMAQYIQIHVFWRPRPGTTYAESTQTNASILYCLKTGTDAISYEGAGFVYFTESLDGKSLSGQIESSALVPARTTGQPADLFGPSQLKGRFIATKDRKRVVAVMQDLRRTLGPAQH